MLFEDFYTIKEQNIGTHEAQYVLRINIAHPIFAGHFPNNPIVPGAVLLQICCNLLTITLKQKLSLTAAKNIKFLNTILPNQTIEITYHIKWEQIDNQYNAKCSIENQDIQFTKMILTMQPLND